MPSAEKKHAAADAPAVKSPPKTPPQQARGSAGDTPPLREDEILYMKGRKNKKGSECWVHIDKDEADEDLVILSNWEVIDACLEERKVKRANGYVLV